MPRRSPKPGHDKGRSLPCSGSPFFQPPYPSRKCTERTNHRGPPRSAPTEVVLELDSPRPSRERRRERPDNGRWLHPHLVCFHLGFVLPLNWGASVVIPCSAADAVREV